MRYGPQIDQYSRLPLQPWVVRGREHTVGLRVACAAASRNPGEVRHDSGQGSMEDKPKLPHEDSADANEESGSPEVPEWLGTQLRELYSDVMNEPMPDKFRDLLKQLEDKEGK